MTHVYIFDYSTASIYHAEIDDFELIVPENFGLQSSQCSFMYSDRELSIEEISKIETNETDKNS